VAPDIGTSAALYATVAYPHLFSSIVVGGGVVEVDCTGDLLKDMIDAQDLSAFSGADGGDIVVPAIQASLPASRRSIRSVVTARAVPRSRSA
jgi:hypothetical protein